MALQGYNALVKVQSSSIAFTDEATTTGDNQIYVITDTNKLLWAYDSTIVVEDGGVPTVENFTVNKLEGKVTFETVNPARVITVTGDYVVATTIAEASQFAFNGSADALDITPFNADGVRSFQAGLRTATVDLTRYFATDDFFITDLLAGTIKIVELYPDSSGTPIRVFGLLTTDTIDSPVDNVLTEALSYQVTTEIFPGV